MSGLLDRVTEPTMPEIWSWSSLQKFLECGEQWRLSRVHRVPDTYTWYATLAGTVVHELTEQVDLGVISRQGALDCFADWFDREIAGARDDGLEIRANGRVTKEIGDNGGPNKKDRDWWLVYGPKYLQKWFDWVDGNGLTLSPEHVERKFSIFLRHDGHEVSVRGIIDRIYRTADGGWIIVDLKTGVLPKSGLQVGTYGIGAALEYGIKATHATYWMASTGELSDPYYLPGWPDGYLERLYVLADQQAARGEFLPNPGAACRSCPVTGHCRALQGLKSSQYPLVDVEIGRRPGGASDPQVEEVEQ